MTARKLLHGLALAVVLLETRDDELVLADTAEDKGLWTATGPEVGFNVGPYRLLDGLRGVSRANVGECGC